MGRNSVRTSVRTSPLEPSRPLRRPSRPLRGPSRPLRRPSRPLRGLRGLQGGTNERTNGISPHSTGLRPLPGPLPKKEDFWVKNQSSDLQQALNCRWLSANNAYSMTFKLGPQAMTRGSLTGLQEAWKWGQNCRKMMIFWGKSIL